jgi:hypothetical protein
MDINAASNMTNQSPGITALTTPPVTSTAVDPTATPTSTAVLATATPAPTTAPAMVMTVQPEIKNPIVKMGNALTSLLRCSTTVTADSLSINFPNGPKHRTNLRPEIYARNKYRTFFALVESLENSECNVLKRQQLFRRQARTLMHCYNAIQSDAGLFSA